MPRANAEMLRKAEEIASQKGIFSYVGTVLTEEIYYSREKNIVQKWADARGRV